MYQKYHTEALVLGNRERGEADKVYALLTEKFGLVYARASAVRAESSRMRYALQNYSRAHVSLVRGKRGWRVAGAIAANTISDTENTRTFARIAALTSRLVGGEEQNQYLFAALADAHQALAHTTGSVRATIEIVCVARILYALGYMSSEAHATQIFAHTAYAHELLREAEAMRNTLLSSINKAIAETHL